MNGSPRDIAQAPVLQCRQLTKTFGTLKVLDLVDLTVGRGEVICIVGPSGSGKSTLLRVMNGLEPLGSGTIELFGTPLDAPRQALAQARRRVGMVFQSFNLFPHLTVRRNVSLAPQRTRKLARREADRLADDLIARVGLADHVDKYPAQLSGGQQQRVAIARALAMEPEILLFDEPTSALDPETVGEVLAVMEELTSTGIAMLIVTHEMGFARRAAHRIAFMDHGRILCDLPPDAFFHGVPIPRLRDFLASIMY